jgi:ABC-type nitrate/sulfonate/bicarbonate transport system ATPase subunit
MRKLMPTAIHCQHLSYRYDNQILLEDLCLSINAQEWYCLLGRSGSGKSTLLRLIAGLTTPSNGRLTTHSKKISYLTQDPALLPWLTAWENTLFTVSLQHKLSDKIKSQAKHLFCETGLEKDTEKYPHELSGGMKSRVALIRLLLENPDIALLDEPFSALDTLTKLHLQTLAASLLSLKTVLFVTHDPLEALRLSDAMGLLEKGKITPLSLPNTKAPRDITDTSFTKQHAALLSTLLETS